MNRVISGWIGSAILALAMGTGGSLQAGEIYQIDQITDMSALTPEEFYRFEPNYYWINPGDTVQFLNSIGNHTVKTVKGMWPEGVEPIDVANLPEYDLTFDTPGVYGIKCKVHNRHGMYALIVVGDVHPDLDMWRDARLNDVGKRVYEALFERLREDVQARYGE